MVSFDANGKEFKDDLTLNYSIPELNVKRVSKVIGWKNFDNNLIDKNGIIHKFNLEEFSEYYTMLRGNEIHFNVDTIKIEHNLILPKNNQYYFYPGTIIDLKNNSNIIAHSNLLMIGDLNNKIKVISSDLTGGGIIVLFSDKESIFSKRK